MATNVRYYYGDEDEITFTSRNELRLAKMDAEGRLILYNYTAEDTFKERVGRFIHNGLQQLWEDGQLCDLEVLIDDKVFRCHRVVLAAVSRYFRSLLTLDQHGGDTGVVRLEGGYVTPEAFEGLLQLLYNGRDVIRDDTVLDMLKAATFLQMPGLEYRCVDMACRQLNEKSCLKMWEWAENYNCPMLASKAKGVALGQFLVLRHTSDFLQMPLERLTTMLGHEMLYFRYEDDLLKAILDWVESDREERCQYLKELLHFVCFPYLSTKYLNELRKHDLIGLKTEYSPFLDEALTFHLAALQKGGKKIQMEVLRRQAHSLKRLMPGMRRVVVLLGGSVVHGEPLANVVACYLEMGHPQSREILAFSIASLPRDVGLQFASAVWKHDIYVSGGSGSPGSLMVYKPNENTWHELKGLSVGRQDHAMVAVGNKLFLLGGRTVTRQGHDLVSEVSVYDIEDGTWDRAGDLLLGVEAAPAVAVGDKIYVLGGRDGRARSVRMVQCLDTHSGHVTVAGHLPQPVEGGRAVVIGRDIILVCPDGPILKIREDWSRGRHAGQDSQEAGYHDDESLSLLEYLEEAASKTNTDKVPIPTLGATVGRPTTPRPADHPEGKEDDDTEENRDDDESFEDSGDEGHDKHSRLEKMEDKMDDKMEDNTTADEEEDREKRGEEDEHLKTADGEAKTNREAKTAAGEAKAADGEANAEDDSDTGRGRKWRRDLEEGEEGDREAEDSRDAAGEDAAKLHEDTRDAAGEDAAKLYEDKPEEEELMSADYRLNIRRIATMDKRRDFGVFVRKSDVVVVGGEAENGNFLDDMLRIHVYTGQTCRAEARLPIPLSGMQVQSTAIHHNYLVQFFDATTCFYGE